MSPTIRSKFFSYQLDGSHDEAGKKYFSKELLRCSLSKTRVEDAVVSIRNEKNIQITKGALKYSPRVQLRSGLQSTLQQ